MNVKGTRTNCIEANLHIPVHSIKESPHERKRHSNRSVLRPNCIEPNLHVSVFQLRNPPMNVKGTRTKVYWGPSVFVFVFVFVFVYF